MSTAELTCNQVNGLLSFYIDNKLSETLKNMVEFHLEICPICRKKMEEMTIMLHSLKEIFTKVSSITLEKKQEEDPFNQSQYKEFHENISAYIDNELSDNENLNVKKYAITNQLARTQLENAFKMQALINNSVKKQKKHMNKDFSGNILNQIDFSRNIYSSDSFFKIAGIFIFIMFTLSIIAIQIFSI